MTAVLASQSSSWFFMKLKAYNDTDRKIPCVVELPSMQDGNLLDTPQEWTCGIVAFSASLGSTSLFYYPKDEDMKIKYVVFEEKGGDLANATPIATQTRSAYKNSYSLGNLMDILNPRACDLGKIPISFFILPGGEIGLGPIASNLVKDLAQDNIQVRRDTRCTDVIMSTQLAKNVKMLGEDISRTRAHTDHATLLHALFFGWMGQPRFLAYKSLARWNLVLPAYGAGRTVDASNTAVPRNVGFRILLPQLNGAAQGGGLYAAIQWSDQVALDGLGNFDLDNFSSEQTGAPLRWVFGGHYGVFYTWSIQLDAGSYYLHVSSTSQIPNGGGAIRIEDPIMKSIAWVFQSAVTPIAEMRNHQAAAANHTNYEMRPDIELPVVAGEVGLLPPMASGSPLFYKNYFSRSYFPAGTRVTRVLAMPQNVTRAGDDYHVIVADADWTLPNAINSDARAGEMDLVYRFQGLNQRSGIDLMEYLYYIEDRTTHNNPYNPEVAAGPYLVANEGFWTTAVQAIRTQLTACLKNIQKQTPTLSKFIAGKIYSGLSSIGVVADATSQDFFKSAAVGETENMITQVYIDDTIALAVKKVILPIDWTEQVAADTFTIQYPDSPALTRWVTGNAGRHLTEPLVLRAYYMGQPQKDFPVVSVGIVANGKRPIIFMKDGSAHALNVDLNGFLIGAVGSVQRQIYTEDLRYATVVENCDEHGQWGGRGFCRFRLLEGDRVVSSEPISDSLQHFKSAAVTSNYGFTFKPETTNMNHAANILQSFSLIHDFSVSMDRMFEPTGCSASPYGDIYYDCGGNITIHQMIGTAALRAGALQLELQPRNPALKPVLAELPVGGSFECKLAFFKLKSKQ